MIYTYRTKISREALSAARGLTPKASEQEKADAFDVFLTENRPFLTIAGDTNRLRAAFLAGQRHEHYKLVTAFIQGAKWWEYIKTGATMWQSDQEQAHFEAVSRGDRLGIDLLASREPKGEQP